MKQQQQPHPESNAPDNQGEGNRDAARRYNQQQREFIEKGGVDEAAELAAPQSKEDAEEMERAEREGRSHAKELDPSVHRDYQRDTEANREQSPSRPKSER